MNLKIIFTVFIWFGMALAVHAAPLLQEGKKTVYQRVVSHPGAALYETEKADREVGKPRTFTSYYVYDRKGDMVRVGVSTSQPDGWLKASDVTDWPQAITMVFTPQMGREPVLFFRDHKSVEELCSSDGIGAKVEEYAKTFSKPGASVPADYPVIASEPAAQEGAVSDSHFYLLPVMDIDDQFSEGGTKLLEVACIDPGSGEQKKSSGEGSGSEKGSGKKSDGMKTGIVFVIDTTISMGPYIEKTKDIIRKIFSQLESSVAKDNVEIALVAFRSDEKLRPKTEYNTKIISDFKPVTQKDEFEEALSEAEECQASTHAFDEDALAGVQEAIENLNWDGIDSRAMLLITDAGPLGIEASRSRMSPEGMADLLKRNNIYLSVAHIKAPSGKKDHAYAEKSYRELSLLGNGRSSYIPIDAPDTKKGAESFEKVGSIIAEKYKQVAEFTQQGKAAPKPSNADVKPDASPEEKAKAMAEAIGYAMQLQFAGNRKDTAAPQVVKAWVADADLPSLEANPDNAPVPVVEPAVLLTKTQLSQLRKQVELIINKAEESFLQDNENFNFYEQLISAAAQMSRDPNAFNKNPDANLAQRGFLLEVLDGLPYKSQILRMRPEDWTNMSTGEQQEFIKRLRGLVSNYEKYDRDNTQWEGFGTPDPNEWVYRVPLKMLP